MDQIQTGFRMKEEQVKPEQVSIPVQVETKISANVGRVWSAWSEQAQVKQWWGPEGFTCPEAKIDFREMGDCLMAMKDSAGNVVWSTGRYQEIIPRQRIVVTDSFADEDGNIIDASEAGMAGEWPRECLLTIDLRELEDDETLMRLTHEGIPSEMHDDCVQGWTSSIEKLKKLVERH